MWGKFEIVYMYISHWTLYIRRHRKGCKRAPEYEQNYQFPPSWINKNVVEKLLIQFLSTDHATTWVDVRVHVLV